MKKIFAVWMLVMVMLPIALADTFDPKIEGWAIDPCIDRGAVRIGTDFDISLWASACNETYDDCTDICQNKYALTETSDYLRFATIITTLVWTVQYQNCLDDCADAVSGACDNVELRAVLFYGNTTIEIDSGWKNASSGFINATHGAILSLPSAYGFNNINTTNASAGWHKLKLYARTNETCVVSQLINFSMGVDGWSNGECWTMTTATPMRDDGAPFKSSFGDYPELFWYGLMVVVSAIIFFGTKRADGFTLAIILIINVLIYFIGVLSDMLSPVPLYVIAVAIAVWIGLKLKSMFD